MTKLKRPKLSATAAKIATMDWFAKAQRAARLHIPEKTVIIQIAWREGEALRCGGNTDDIQEVMRMLEAARLLIWQRAQEIAAQLQADQKTRETVKTIGAKL